MATIYGKPRRTPVNVSANAAQPPEASRLPFGSSLAERLGVEPTLLYAAGSKEINLSRIIPFAVTTRQVRTDGALLDTTSALLACIRTPGDDAYYGVVRTQYSAANPVGSHKEHTKYFLATLVPAPSKQAPEFRPLAVEIGDHSDRSKVILSSPLLDAIRDIRFYAQHPLDQDPHLIIHHGGVPNPHTRPAVELFVLTESGPQSPDVSPEEWMPSVESFADLFNGVSAVAAAMGDATLRMIPPRN